MRASTKTFNCHMELTLNVMGGKWKPIIIYHIGHNEQIRYGELRRLIPAINERVLSKELRQLEELSLIRREVFNEKILRVEYSLTPIGYELLPVLNNLSQWGRLYNSKFNYASILCK